MSHSHCDHCEHDLKYCGHCDIVYCTKCKKEWGKQYYWYYSYPYYCKWDTYTTTPQTTYISGDTSCKHKEE